MMLMDNMHTCHEAEVTVEPKANGKSSNFDYTKISFVPDLARLTNDPNVTILPEEEYKMMRRRVVDVAGSSGGKLTVTLNGEEISISGFEEYVNLHRHPALESTTPPPPMVYHKLNARWEVAIGLSETKSARRARQNPSKSFTYIMKNNLKTFRLIRKRSQHLALHKIHHHCSLNLRRIV